MSALETIGVDLGGTKMLVGAVAPGPEVTYSVTETVAGRDQKALVELLVTGISVGLEARPEARAVGLGIPCTIDRERGIAINAVNLPIADLPIAELLGERIDVPVFIDNDANVAALAEHRFGAARGADNAVLMTIGTGIGGGLIIGGEPYRGSSGAGAELGHIVVDADGPPCQGSCPSRGCLEAVASGTAIGREGLAAAQRSPDSELGRMLADGEKISGAVVTVAAHRGDAAAIEVLAVVGTRLGTGLASLANVFEPDLIVLGGGAMAAGEMLLGPAREELAARALPPQNRTPVRSAELGPDAGMIGAATMAAIELERRGAG